MLDILRIKNFAVIEFVEIPFKKGLNIISGETGAGKSIVIQAVSLVLGGRASAEIIRTGCESAVIEAVFDLSQRGDVQEKLSRYGLESGDRELLIRREVYTNGRNRVFVNGGMSTLSALQDICEGLVDLCGQHEHQTLLKPIVQLGLIDRFVGISEKAGVFSVKFRALRALQKELEDLRSGEDDKIKRLGYLQFQKEELEGAGLVPGEDDALRSEKEKLRTVKERSLLVGQIREIFQGETHSLTDLMTTARHVTQQLVKMDPSLGEFVSALDSVVAQVEDLGAQMSRYESTMGVDPERLAAVDERLALIAGLRRKYGETVEQMLLNLAEVEVELASLSARETSLAELESVIGGQIDVLSKMGQKLSKERIRGAKQFSEAVAAELKDLKMPDAEFDASVSFDSDFSTWGAESSGNQVLFKICTNRGEEAKSISKIASGGELSRIMLAIRRVVSDRGGIGVYLFDEIDAGIGGRTAFRVGRKLHTVSRHNQVICITHLAQVCAFADHHLSVNKTVKGKRTETQIEVLEKKTRLEENARMLGGEKPSATTLRSARELVESARV